MAEKRATTRVPLTQSAEPPMWMVDPPGAGGLENPVDPPGSEAPPTLADQWDDE